MLYPTLYKRDTEGKIQQWTIEVEGSKYRTIHGDYGGKLVSDAWTTAKTKNAGRANSTTPEQQAVKEALAKITLKKKKGYTEDPTAVDEAAVFKVMLAEKFSDYESEVVFPVLEEPKLDGLRCRADKTGLWSRENNQFKNCPHIERALAPLFEKHPDLILDGELYNHDYADDFNSLISFVKKGKPTPESIAEAEKYVQFWIYNYVNTDAYLTRYLRLQEWILPLKSPYLKLVPATQCATRKELDEKYEGHLENKFEGQMVYAPYSAYIHKRTKALLKRKEFIDDEFPIVSIEEGVGNRSGKAGAIWLTAKNGKKFKANPKGNRKFLTDLLKNREALVGVMATVEYQNLTPEEQVPRFGRVIKIRNYE